MKINFVVTPTDEKNPIGFEAWIDNTQFFSAEQLEQKQTIEYEMSDDDSNHTLKFVVKNKTSSYTKLNDNQEIIQDSCIQVEHIQFDDLDISNNLLDLFVYTHDFNGSGQVHQDKFYKTLGCNGTVSLNFNLPIYIWFLENM